MRACECPTQPSYAPPAPSGQREAVELSPGLPTVVEAVKNGGHLSDLSGTSDQTGMVG